MDFEFTSQDDFLVVRLSGVAGPNERLLAKEALLSSLQSAAPRVIVDMGGLRGLRSVYSVGVLNTLKKEVRLRGGKIKLCALAPEVEGYFRKNRLDRIFAIEPSVEAAKRRFREESDDRESG